MSNISIQKSLEFAKQLSPPRSPIALCHSLGIEVVSNKPIEKDGYLVCCDGLKLIFVSSGIQDFHRRKFVISHEIGHFLLHRDNLYGCSNILDMGLPSVNTTHQESEANQFASEYLMPENDLKRLIPSRSLTFTDIKQIATYFDVSVTFAAFKSVQLSNTEDEILVCYEGQKRKWYISADRTLFSEMIPMHCPINLLNVPLICDISGVWNSLYVGTVHQEIFRPFQNQKLVLLSGKRFNAQGRYYEL